MQRSFDGTMKRKVLFNLIFWLPFLFREAGDDCGYDYSFTACMFLSLGTALPLAALIIFYKFKIALMLGIFSLNSLFLGILASALTYLLIGIIAHFSIKSVWGSGIL